MNCTACQKPANRAKSYIVYLEHEIIENGERLCSKCLEERKALVAANKDKLKTYPKFRRITTADQVTEETVYCYGHTGTTLRKLPLKTSLKHFANK